MQYIDAHAAYLHRIAVAQFPVELDDSRSAGESNPRRLNRQRSVKRQIRRMQQPFSARALAQRPEIADVVDMRMGVDQVGRAQAARCEPPYNLVDAVAAIDHDCLAGLLVADDRAVAGERSDCKGFDKHAALLTALRRERPVAGIRWCRYSKEVDIQNDLAAVQQRIAQITGTLAPEAAPASNGAFASLVSSFSPQTAAAPRGMQRPVTGPVTSDFGERKNPLGPGSDFHPGLDIAADEGTPIAAAASGRVVAAGPDGGYGNLIVVDNGNGVTTRYGHCSQIYARVGEFVNAGQPIGAVGSTGRSTGPHLHFEVRMNDTPVDPAPYLTR